MRQRRMISGLTIAVGVAVVVCALAFGFTAGLATQQSAEELYQAALLKQEAEGDLSGAIKLLEDLITKFPGRRDVAAKAQLQIGACYEKLGLKQAQEAYEKVIEKYPDQGEAVREAQTKLALLIKAGAAKPSESREMRVRMVYDGNGPEWGNALSSDGRYLVYTDWFTGDMAVVDLATKEHRRITSDGGMDKPTGGGFGETSAFSADDKRVAYGWQGDNRINELRGIDFDGTNQQVLLRDENTAWIQPHAWSQDGKNILLALMRKDDTCDIAMLSIPGNKISIVRKVAAKSPEMALSPDGEAIAYSMAPEAGSSKRDIFLMNADGSGHEAIVSHPADDYLLGWSPDGCRIVFASDRSGASGVWAVEVADGHSVGSPQWLKSDLSPDPVRLTPDGTLYYQHMESLHDVFTVPIDPDSGKSLGAPIAVKSRLTGIRTGPDWSPDGKRLAYKYFTGEDARTQGKARISVLDVGSSEEKIVETGLTSPIALIGPRWSPDGRSITLVGSRAPGENGIYQVDIPGGAVRLLVKFPPQSYCLQTAWAPDGKSIFYSLGNPTRILRRDLESGQDIEFGNMKAPVGVPRLALSRDGKWLAFTSADTISEPRKLLLVPAAGGNAREICRTKEGEYVQWISWSPDGRSIWLKMYTPPADDKGRPSIEFRSVSPDGKDVRKLEMPLLGAQDLRLHPDGRQIAFWTGQAKLELWALENFLPEKK